MKVAIITGAGTGIGKAAALELLKEDFAVVLAGRRVEPLEATAMEGKASGAPTLVVPTDVADPDAVKNLFAKTKEKFGRLDLLFNNAGFGGPPVLLEDLPYEKWKAVVDTNLTGAFLCTQEAFKIDEGARTSRRADHQQWIHLGTCSASEFRGLYFDQACNDGTNQGDVARWT